MKYHLYVGLVIVFFTGACSGNVAQTFTAPLPTKTDVPAAEPTLTSSLTAIPITSTTTFTSTPSIPSSTPTFDVSSIITVTPAAKEECPDTQSVEGAGFDFLDLSYDKPENRAGAEKNTLDFLNTYGANTLVEYLRYRWGKEGRFFAYKDLTGDNVPELSIGLIAFYIFGCKNGKYERLLEIPPDGYLRPSTVFSIKDNNRNGISEITLLVAVLSQGGQTYQIYEWDGSGFRGLVYPVYDEYPDSGFIWVEVNGRIFYQDVDHDLLNELILDSGIPLWETYYSGLPWRNKRTVYEWNGQNYIPDKFSFAPPEFRFQAIQDGDLAAGQNEFDKAQSLYQDAIFSDKLKDYSPEIRKNLQDNWMSRVGGVRPTPTPYPRDPTEYPRLAAYAYYRLMLLHLVRGYESDAMTVFNTLQQKFPEENPGYLYSEMATAFILEYQSTHEMALACDAAVQFSQEHPEILVPLGSDYHGWQSHTYKPEDVCPFR